MLRYIRTMDVPNELHEISTQLWRKCLKSSYFCHIGNYLRFEARDILPEDSQYLRQQKMLRSVLLGDLAQSVVTAETEWTNKMYLLLFIIYYMLIQFRKNVVLLQGFQFFAKQVFCVGGPCDLTQLFTWCF